MRILTFILGIGLFIVMPFAFSPKLQDVEQSPRFLMMAVIVVAAAVAVAVSLLSKRKAPFIIPGSRFHFVILAWVAVTFVGWMRSINDGDGLFELLKILLFVSLYFLFLISIANDAKGRLWFYRCITSSLILFIAIGVSQALPQVMEALESGQPLKVDYSITSSLGNKNFFAEMLLLMLPFAFLCFVNDNRMWKTISAIAMILVVVILILLQTLSTWLALVTAVFVLMLLLIAKRELFLKNSVSGKSILLFAGGGVLVVALSLVVFFSLTDTSQITKRITDFRQLLSDEDPTEGISQQNSVRDRVVMWKNAVHVAEDYPLFGTGLANLKIIAPEYGLGSDYHIAEGTIVYTHPHNEFLFVQGELGLTGLIIYVMMFAMLFVFAWKQSAQATSSQEFLLPAAILFMMVCLLVISMVSLPSTRFYPSVMVMLAAALLVNGAKNRGDISVSQIKKFGWVPLALIFLTGGYAAAVGNSRMKSDFALSDALISERKRNFGRMKQSLLTIDRSAYPIDVNSTPVAWYLGYVEFYLGNREAAFTYFTEAEKVNRNHLMLLNDLGTCYNLKGDPATAELYYRKALSNQPYFGNALVNLAVLQFNAGQLDSSYQTLMKHKTKISQDHVNVFATIISAKAANYTSDTLIINKIRHEFRNPYSSQDAFRILKGTPGGLPEYIRKL
jgi:O-antigen ligase